MRPYIVLVVIAIMFQPLNMSVPETNECSSKGIEPTRRGDFEGPLLIGNNTGFENHALSRGWVGNGSALDPFIIEDLIIDANGTGYGLAITTTYSFIIRNCSIGNATGGGSPIGAICIIQGNGTIRDCSVNHSGYGIRVLTPCRVENNTVLDCNNGIWVIADDSEILENKVHDGRNQGIHYQGDGSLISRNIVTGYDLGLIIIGSDNNRLEYNTIYDIDDHGIRLDRSDYNVVIGNHAWNNDDGVFLEFGSQHNVVANNSVMMCEEGIYIKDANDTKCHGNDMRHCSFRMGPGEDNFRSQIISENNTVDGLPVRYRIEGEYDDTVFDRPSGQIILYGSQNTTLKDLEIPNGSMGIVLFDCVSTKIINCTLTDHVYNGIDAFRCKDMIIQEVVISGCDRGILIEKCRDGALDSIIMNGNREGVFISSSENIALSVIRVENGDFGVTIYYDSSNISMDDFYISGVAEYGIDMRTDGVNLTNGSVSDGNGSHDIGIRINAEDCRIENCTVSKMKTGIRAEFTSGGQYTRNHISDCVRGLYMFRSSGDLAEYNHIEGDKGDYGIIIDTSRSSMIRENKLSGSMERGILLSGSSGIELKKNDIDGSHIDIDISAIEDDPGYVIPPDNTVDGLPVFYRESEDLDGVNIPDGKGEYIFLRCRNGMVRNITQYPSGVGILAVASHGMNMVNLSFGGTGTGVHLKDCSSSNIVDSVFDSLECGVYSYGSGYTSVSGCEFINLSDSGLNFTSSENAVVYSSVFKGGYRGIYLFEAVGISVRRSMFSEVGCGIRTVGRSDSLKVNECGFLENLGFGIHTDEGRFGWVRDCSFVNNGRNLPFTGHIWMGHPENTIDGNYYGDMIAPDDDSNGFVDDPYILDFDDFNLTDMRARSFLPHEVLGPPTRHTSIQYLDRIVLSWESPNNYLVGSNIKGFIVRRLRNNLTEPFSWYVRNGTGMIDHDPGNSSEITYTVQTVSELGESSPVFLFSRFNLTEPHVRFDMENGSVLDTRTVDLSFTASISRIDILSETILLDGEQVFPGDDRSGYIFNVSGDGVHHASIEIRDRRGYTAYNAIEFLVDTISPEVTVLKEGNWTNSTMKIDYDSYDINGVENLFLTVINNTMYSLEEIENIYPEEGTDGTDIMTRSNGLHFNPEVILEKELKETDSSISLELKEGNYTAFIRAYDVAGNAGSAIANFGVDRTAPEVVDWAPKGYDADVDSVIEVSLNEELKEIMQEPDSSHEWVNTGKMRYGFMAKKLEFFTEYRVSIHGIDRAGNHLMFDFSFRTEKDPDWNTTVTLMITGTNGDPLQDVTVNINNVFERTTLNNGRPSEPFHLGEGNYTAYIFSEGFVNRNLSFKITYGQGPVDLGEIPLEQEGDSEDTGDETPYLLFIVGTALILITIYFAVSAFMRKGGPLDEE